VAANAGTTEDVDASALQKEWSWAPTTGNYTHSLCAIGPIYYGKKLSICHPIAYKGWVAAGLEISSQISPIFLML
jgi:hypothetical protein